jgi:gluconate kinase
MARDVDRLTDATQLDGWIPVRVYWSNGRPTIDWCYLGRRGFTESSFEQTVEACLRYPANLLFRHQTSIEVLQQLSETRPGLEPTGFIFHMSRCGSTLISQMLAALSKNIVISEARPIDSILRAHLRDGELTDGERIGWLRWLVSALGQQRLGTERHLFIVFDSWNALELSMVRRAFPDVPWVFLYRDPLEVLVSQIGQRGAETIPGVFPASYFGMNTEAVSFMEPEEYCASVLAALCQAALRQHADGGMLINYRQLPEVVGPMCSEFFGVSCSGAEKETMNTAVASQADVDMKEKVSERLREAASSLLYPIYEELETARLAIHQSRKR